MNVLYCFDSNFWRMAAVSISTLVKTQRSPEKLVIYCMVPPRTGGRRKIAQIVQASGARLVWRKIRSNPFYRHDYSRWSPVIFYRIFACNVFPDIERMLYIDADTIIRDDLTEMYNTDLTGYVMGAVRDMARVENPDSISGTYVREFKEKYLPRASLYINSGVLLLNMPRMRERLPKMLSLDIPLKYPDQDILNAGLDGEILELPLRYNIIPETEIAPKFTPEIVAGATENAAIHHFYAIKPYYYNSDFPKTYSEYFRASDAIGFCPDDFIRVDMRRKRRAKQRLSGRSHIPGIRFTRRGNIRMFGLFRI